MLPTGEYTKIIYSNNVKVDTSNTEYKMIATNTIKRGDLLLAEHVIEGGIECVMYIVAYNEILNDNLHPRTTDRQIDEIIAREKVSLNAFLRTEGEYCIGTNITKINHNCNPNCIISFEEINWTHGIPLIIAKIYAIRNISDGDEITISYHPSIGHEDTQHFVCTCARSKETRDKIFKLGHNIVEDDVQESKILTNEFLIKYVDNPSTKHLMFRHYLTNFGLLFMNKYIIKDVGGKRIGINNMKDALKKEIDDKWTLFNAQYCNKQKIKIHKNIKKQIYQFEH